MRRSLAALTALAVALSPCVGPGSLVTRAQAQQAAAPAQTAPADVFFTRAELEKLLMPIALFPDPLLAQMLPASAYPLEIVQAARWLDRNKAAVEKQDFSAADAMPWDASVKALMRFPDLIRRLNEDLDWTSDLGDAFVHQPEDVATVIQDLRLQAEKGGALKSTPQQTVVRRMEGTREVIIIEPANPEIIYVPVYDPTMVFNPVGATVATGLLTFAAGVAVGSIISNNYWNWGRGVVYPPIWPGYPSFRPPYPGWRPGVTRPGNINVGNINIGNDINIGNGNLIGNSKPWRPDPDRYRPGQGSKPGLARPENRPGGIGGPGSRPGPGERPLNRPTTLPAEIGGGSGLGGAGAAVIGGAAGGAIGGAIANRPSPGIQRPADRPSLDRPAQRPSLERPVARPAPSERPQVRPTAPNRPTTLPATRPAAPVATRPAPRPNGFDNIGAGAGAAAFGNRGAASRGQISRPAGGGGGAAMRPAPARSPGAARPGGGGGGGGRGRLR